MNCIGTKLTKNYAWELGFLYFIRAFSDGISWVEFNVSLDLYKGDHSPKFGIRLIIMNLLICDFSIYNVTHVEEQDESM